MKPAKGRSKMQNSLRMKDIAGGKLRKNYVLPDFLHVMKGYIKGDDELITKEEQVLVFLRFISFSDSFFIQNRY
jgi:hypothetical protein